MRYFLDTEFNGFGGELISLALVRADGESLYLVYPTPLEQSYDPWVLKNVVPFLWVIPSPLPGMAHQLTHGGKDPTYIIQEFLNGDPNPLIITDWPDDIRYFCQTLITGPGTMINIPKVSFEMVRVDAYPTTLEGAVQHNAWWDAMALREKYRWTLREMLK